MMRLFILALGFMLIGVWLNIVFNNYFQIGGLKINWMLIFMLVLTFRHPSLLVVPFVGVLAGLICDALSHGIMGLYGISFFVTLLLARQVIKAFYANTFFSVGIAVLGMSFFEGWISLSILGQFEESLNQFPLIMTSTLPLAVLQGLASPIILQSVIWGEKLYLRDAA